MPVSVKKVIHLPFEIKDIGKACIFSVPSCIIVPKEIQLKPRRILPETIKLPEGFVLPSIELEPEDIPIQSLREKENPNRIPAVDVRIYQHLSVKREQYVEFNLNNGINKENLIGHCLFPTHTLLHGPVKDWEFQVESPANRVRLLIPTALYHEFIFPHYFANFWCGLTMHLLYLKKDNWWATHHL